MKDSSFIAIANQTCSICERSIFEVVINESIRFVDFLPWYNNALNSWIP